MPCWRRCREACLWRAPAVSLASHLAPPGRLAIDPGGERVGVAWHRSLGREAFWIPPHVVLYSGVGLTGLVCAGVVVPTTLHRATRAGMDPTPAELWGLRAPLGFVLAGCGVLGCVLVAPFDEWWHRLFGLDVTVWSPPHLFAIGAAGAIRLGGVVALAREMSRAGRDLHPQQRVWSGMSLAEGVLLVLFSLLLGNLTFVLGGSEYWASPREGVTYTLMASLVVPVVLVSSWASRGRARRGGCAGSPPSCRR
jgi:hypothetical protein